MRIVYTIVIHSFYILMIIGALFNKKARLWVNGRKNWRERLNKRQVLNNPVFWFHAASLGEYEQGLPVMEALRKSIPGCSIAVSFFSPSGYEVRKNSAHADLVFYLPLDTNYNAAGLIEILKPDAVFFIKYEYWYFFLHKIRSKGIPVYLLSGIFRPQQVFFKWYGWWFRKNVHAFRYLFVQNDFSASLLSSIGINNSVVTGDTRFDRVLSNAAKAAEVPLVSEFASGQLCIVAGSTWPADEILLADHINKSPSGIKYIIAPHETDREHVARLARSILKETVLYSLADSTNVKNKQVMIIDNVGMLSSIYRYGQIAYIGGGFGKGIHNLLEAAVYGIPVIFGPNYHKFREAIELIDAGAGFTISDSLQLENVLAKLITLDQTYQAAGHMARKYVENNAGATAKVLTHVLPDIGRVN